MIVSPLIGLDNLRVTAQETISSGLSNSTNPNTSENVNNSSNSNIESEMLGMTQSEKPEDIATLAYIWAYPLITMQRSFEYFTNPDTIAKGITGAGEPNSISFARELINASFKDV